MNRSRYEVCADVRRVLIRHWLDPEALHTTLVRDAVRVSGIAKPYGSGQPEAINAGLFEAVEAEMRRVSGVRRVQLDFSNWRRNGEGQWMPIAHDKSQRTLETPDDAKTQILKRSDLMDA